MIQYPQEHQNELSGKYHTHTIVAMTTLRGELEVNDLIWFLTVVSVHDVYMSTK